MIHRAYLILLSYMACLGNIFLDLGNIFWELISVGTPIGKLLLLKTERKKIINSLQKICNQLQIIWGFLFRLIFIGTIGYICFWYFNPTIDIINTPICELTISNLVGRLIATILALLCCAWICYLEEVNFKAWGIFGGYITFLTFCLIVLLIFLNS